MSNIYVNYEEVGRVIGNLQGQLKAYEMDLNGDTLEKLENSSGETAEALRNLQKVEKELMNEVAKTLSVLAGKIRSATNELKNLDKEVSIKIQKEPSFRN